MSKAFPMDGKSVAGVYLRRPDSLLLFLATLAAGHQIVAAARGSLMLRGFGADPSESLPLCRCCVSTRGLRSAREELPPSLPAAMTQLILSEEQYPIWGSAWQRSADLAYSSA